MKNNKNCKICNSETKFNSETCSKKCAGELKKQKNWEYRNCLVCNNEFYVRKKNNKKLCSNICRKEWASRPDNKKKRIENSKNAIKEKYGTDNLFTLEDIKNKANQTKLKKYGTKNYVNTDKAKKTKEKKYGDKNYNNLSKIKKTKKEKYGDENYNNRNKAKATMKKLYGQSHAMKLKKTKNKVKLTNLKKYGVEYPTQSNIIKLKTKKTNLNKYGFNSPSQHPEIKKRVQEFYIKNFKKTKIYKILNEMKLEIKGEYKGRDFKPYIFVCKECKNEFSGTFCNNYPPYCKVCNPIYKNNKLHQIVKEILIESNLEFKENEKWIINPYELDFYIPKLNIAIEINGNYYHSEIGGKKNKYYHFNKSKLCEEKKIKLIHIFEDEIVYKTDIAISRIKSIINCTNNKLYARKCIIKEIDSKQKTNFLLKNHIQGNSNDQIRLGLFYEEELVSVMTFSKKRIALGYKKLDSNSWELARFCSKINFNIIGSFSKLLKYFIRNYSPKEIITYADCRWSGINPENTVYNKSGFKFIHISQPNYWYFNKGNYLKRFHRFNYRKSEILKLSPELTSNTKTEWENAQILGMDRIWDCGSMKFIMSIKKGL